MDNVPQLRPSFSHSLHGFDLSFCIELAKIGYVRILSRQVEFVSEKGHLSFTDYSSDSKKCNGLKLPDNWVIEFMCIDGDAIKITFGVQKKEVVNG